MRDKGEGVKNVRILRDVIIERPLRVIEIPRGQNCNQQGVRNIAGGSTPTPDNSHTNILTTKRLRLIQS